MSKIYNNGIITTAGFQFNADLPLDDRLAVETLEDLTASTKYDGMIVYVKNEQKHYAYINESWVPLNEEAVLIPDETQKYSAKSNFGGATIGENAKYSLSFGNQTQANGEESVALNFKSKANGNRSFAANYSEANGKHSFAANYGIANGEQSAAFGYATADGDYQMAVGTQTAENKTALFKVGNGTANNPKNAFEVTKDGRAKVQTAPKESTDVVRKAELDKLTIKNVSYIERDSDQTSTVSNGRLTCTDDDTVIEGDGENAVNTGGYLKWGQVEPMGFSARLWKKKNEWQQTTVCIDPDRTNEFIDLGVSGAWLTPQTNKGIWNIGHPIVPGTFSGWAEGWMETEALTWVDATFADDGTGTLKVTPGMNFTGTATMSIQYSTGKVTYDFSNSNLLVLSLGTEIAHKAELAPTTEENYAYLPRKNGHLATEEWASEKLDIIKTLIDTYHKGVCEIVDSVSDLPTASEDTIGKIYLVRNSTSSGGTIKDSYKEYITIRINSYSYRWELLGVGHYGDINGIPLLKVNLLNATVKDEILAQTVSGYYIHDGLNRDGYEKGIIYYHAKGSSELVPITGGSTEVINKELNEFKGSNYVYATGSNGVFEPLKITSNLQESTIIYRDANGRAKVADAGNNGTDIVNNNIILRGKGVDYVYRDSLQTSTISNGRLTCTDDDTNDINQLDPLVKWGQVEPMGFSARVWKHNGKVQQTTVCINPDNLPQYEVLEKKSTTYRYQQEPFKSLIISLPHAIVGPTKLKTTIFLEDSPNTGTELSCAVEKGSYDWIVLTNNRGVLWAEVLSPSRILVRTDGNLNIVKVNFKYDYNVYKEVEENYVYLPSKTGTIALTETVDEKLNELAPIAKSGQFEDLLIGDDIVLVLDGGGADIELATLDKTILL